MMEVWWNGLSHVLKILYCIAIPATLIFVIYYLLWKGITIMNPSLLGKKIKEARLAKKMTQKEVVGNFITRNMLSFAKPRQAKANIAGNSSLNSWG